MANKPSSSTTPQSNVNPAASASSSAATSPTKPNPADQNRTALDQIGPYLQAIPKERLVRNPATDVRRACAHIIELVRVARGPDILPRLKELPNSQWDIGCLDRTELAARAVTALFNDRADAEAVATNTKIDAALAEEAAVTRRRMLTLCNYQFADDPEIAPQLADIAHGTGHFDTADDLMRLARIYDAHPDVVSADRKNYRPTDASRAHELADQISAQVSSLQTSPQSKVQEAQARAWTFLVEQYDELRRAVTFSFWSKPAVSEMFGPVHSFGRKPARRASKSAEPAQPAAIPAAATKDSTK